MNKKRIATLQKKLLAWFEKNGRTFLPWRTTTNLYHITVSEVMLQQTQVSRVQEKYPQFLKAYPSWESLASASQADLLRQWQGMGYNRRAINLHKLAKEVHGVMGGNLPEDVEELQKLPGIGPYTSAAILVFGRNKPVPAVDVNVERVIGRWTNVREKKELHAIIETFLPQQHARDWHNGLMDFASRVCTKRNPTCHACPMKTLCTSFPNPQDAIVAKKQEIGREEQGKHVPRRIFRGRIVEYLRENNATTQAIGMAIKQDWEKTVDTPWLKEILTQLQKEDLIEFVKKKWRLKE